MKNIILISVLLSFFALSSCKEECAELYKEGCVTDNKYVPVCGCNGKTYANRTYAECAGVEYSDGKCIE